jgi:hypothetical protein
VGTGKGDALPVGEAPGQRQELRGGEVGGAIAEMESNLPGRDEFAISGSSTATSPVASLSMGTRDLTFQLWIEFEHYAAKPDDDPADDFFNMMITMSDGSQFALNIWTFAYLRREREEAEASGESLGGRYLLPPDLFVERLDRALLEEIVSDLIRGGLLKEEWRVTEPPS